MAVAKKKKTETKADKIHKGKWHKTLAVLATAFFAIWVVIGILVLVIIFANFRQGAFQGLFAEPRAQQVPTAPQVPTTTELSGVGTVDIACIQSSLSEEAISKLVTDESTDNFTAEETASLDPCVVVPLEDAISN